MHFLYIGVAAVLIALATVFLSPVVGIIALIVLVGLGFALFGAAGGAAAGRLRTSDPEPTGRPRAARAGAETANQRQGQD